jgi:hypothetical protein
MWVSAGTSLMLLLFAVRAHAAACPDYAAHEEEIVRILQYEKAASLPDAYERLAETWFCLHPNVSAYDFVRWVRSIPSNGVGATNLQARAFGANRVVSIWARHDVPDGGRATLYARQNGRWARQAFVALDLLPEVVATLADRDLVVREQNKIARVTTGNVRVLRVEGNNIAEQLFEADIDNSKIISSTTRRIVIAFERVPRGFSIDETSMRLAYTLTITARGTKTVGSTRTLTPGLEAMEQYCGSAADSPTASVRRQLPDCSGVRVSEVRSLAPGRQSLSIEAPLVCQAADGSISPIQHAVVAIERARGAYRVARLSSPTCAFVRARGKHADAFRR